MNLKGLNDLEEELRYMQAKLSVIVQKQVDFKSAELQLRAEMQHLENQVARLKQLKI